MPVITVSKEHGAGGKHICEALARGLGYDLVDKALIVKVAQQAKVTANRVENFDQEGYSPLTKYLDNVFLSNPGLYSGGAFEATLPGAGLMAPVSDQYDFFNAEQYLQLTRTVIESLYQKGNVVIVGRGSQVILGDKPSCLHLRLTAPLEYRIGRVTSRQNVSPKEARDIIHKRDKSRASYIRDYYGQDWSDAALYHLVVNTSRWTMDGVAGLVAGAIKQIT